MERLWNRRRVARTMPNLLALTTRRRPWRCPCTSSKCATSMAGSACMAPSQAASLLATTTQLGLRCAGPPEKRRTTNLRAPLCHVWPSEMLFRRLALHCGNLGLRQVAKRCGQPLAGGVGALNVQVVTRQAHRKHAAAGRGFYGRRRAGGARCEGPASHQPLRHLCRYRHGRGTGQGRGGGGAATRSGRRVPELVSS